MIQEYTFTIETDEEYYSNLFKLKRNATIGRPWIVWTLGFMVGLVSLFLTMGFFLGEGIISYTLLLSPFLLGFYVYRAYRGNKKLKTEYLNNLSQEQKVMLVTISQDQFIINENGNNIVNNWNEYHGFEKSSKGIVLGFLNAQLLFLDNEKLKDKTKDFLKLLKSKEQNT